MLSRVTQAYFAISPALLPKAFRINERLGGRFGTDTEPIRYRPRIPRPIARRRLGVLEHANINAVRFLERFYEPFRARKKSPVISDCPSRILKHQNRPPRVSKRGQDSSNAQKALFVSFGDRSRPFHPSSTTARPSGSPFGRLSPVFCSRPRPSSNHTPRQSIRLVT